MAANDEKPVIIIKRIKKVAGGHHGGAWKVAYADFVTAMMAFFLLLWLLNVTTDEQKALISSYFSPSDPRIAESLSGAGGVMGGTTVSSEGAMTSMADPVSANPAMPSDAEISADTLENAEDKALEEELARREEERFEETQEKIQQALESSPELKKLIQNLIIDLTPEGLRIQIIDQKGKSMFQLGRAEPLPHTIALLKLVSNAIRNLPNKLSIRGHTDSKPYGSGAKYTNWELSSDRANASRRVLLETKLPLERIENVMGRADRELLDKKNPYSPRNRRITLMLLKESIVKGVHKKDKPHNTYNKRPKADKKPPKAIKKQEEGIIYFP